MNRYFSAQSMIHKNSWILKEIYFNIDQTWMFLEKFFEKISDFLQNWSFEDSLVIYIIPHLE